MKEFSVASTSAPGVMGVDWEVRVDFERLRRHRIARVHEMLEQFDLGAILLFETSEDVPEGEIVEPLGVARVVREGSDVTIAALALMVPRALEAAERLSEEGISAEVVDVRSLVPLDTGTLLASVVKTGRFFTVEENPRLCGWGAELVSIVSEEAFWDLDGPSIRITTPHIPLPSAAALEDLALPSVDRIFDTISRVIDSRVGA
jgi:pyruvate dehydrogenase E1 component beta subunit